MINYVLATGTELKNLFVLLQLPLKADFSHFNQGTTDHRVHGTSVEMFDKKI